jgi:hypothetical protein
MPNLYMRAVAQPTASDAAVCVSDSVRLLAVTALSERFRVYEQAEGGTSGL